MTKTFTIPFITGDGIGQDITPCMIQVINALLEKTYNNQCKIHWEEHLMGAAALKQHGDLLPQETLDAIQRHKIAIKGPLETPVGGGMRSVNVALRQKLELFMCVRPVQYMPGSPSPVKHPEKVDMVIFRENSEDIYAGIEWEAGSKSAKAIIEFMQTQLNSKPIQNAETCAIGIKPISIPASQRIMKAAIEYAIQNKKNTITLVHKGNIMKFTEGGFKQWAENLAVQSYGAQKRKDGWLEIPTDYGTIVVKNCIADAFLQEILLKPEEHQVVVTTNLNGDYISDALAAQVGGIGIAPGANLSDTCAVFEATHGTAPKIAGKNVANPCSLLLSARMMLQHMNLPEAADNLYNAISRTIQDKLFTQDFYHILQEGECLSTQAFGEAVIQRLKA